MNSYGYHEGYGTGLSVLTLNVLATTDDFMSVDRKSVLTLNVLATTDDFISVDQNCRIGGLDGTKKKSIVF